MQNKNTNNLNMPVLLARDLQKTYENITVLNQLSFSLEAGRILGFLGPNGAGKTTAIRILTTIMSPTSGSFFINGISGDDPSIIRKMIGVLPESNGFPESMSAIEFLTYHGSLYGLLNVDAYKCGMELLNEVGLAGKENSYISTFSRGMRQRLGIARSIINNPLVVFLDEPTLGLDPSGQEELLTLIKKIALERKTAVVFCSHLLPEVERLCDDVIILRQGSVVANGTVAEVIAGSIKNLIRIHIPQNTVKKALETLLTLPNISDVKIMKGTNDWLDIYTATNLLDKKSTEYIHNVSVLKALITNNIPVISFETGGGHLQDVFLKLTK